ncbi:hypothetical protein ASPTUDRAFT_786216 [Aspergillus tubingensis CBS 134.48]|uniref:TAP-C domain-containing protein n=1 Tax=Aspergillus tubingensis (strain CBS 134.48) TaxID=767770 RepID=A0A1L9MV26_ASPTC|nr:hypothetical protein ASPTUDRAFT_786216 [Aspergillus tubingensis CBS 134.48]
MRGTCTGTSHSASSIRRCEVSPSSHLSSGLTTLLYISSPCSLCAHSHQHSTSSLPRWLPNESLHPPPSANIFPAGHCLPHPTMPPYSTAQKQCIMQFVNLTQAKDAVAAKFLKASRWNVEQALDACWCRLS